MEGSDSSPAPTGGPPSDHASLGADQGFRVLVVEDNPADGFLIRAQLGRADRCLRVHVEEDFDEALVQLCSGRFHAATIDHQLGANTGLQLIELARQRGVQIPLVLLTGSDDPIIEREAVAGGASDFLAKSEATGRLLARTVRFNVQRCAASAALAERERRYEAVVAGSQDGIWDWDLIESPLDLGGRSVRVGVSIGIRVVTDVDVSPADLLSAADAAMYSRKQKRKARAGLGAKRTAKTRDISLDTRLRRALEAGLVVPNYQPIVTAASSEVVGFEALARWKDEELGHVSPAQFIPAAFRTGLIEELGRQMLLGACTWAASNPAKSLVSISVNVSADHVRAPRFVSHVRDALARSGLDPRRLQLELTEQVKWDNDDAIDASLGALRDEGVCLVLDDFGNGYSTTEVLARFPVSAVKLSRDLLLGAQADPRRKSMYEGLVGLAKRLGASVTAEGIETAEQLALVKDAGATHIQGFMFGRPSAQPAVPRKAA